MISLVVYVFHPYEHCGLLAIAETLWVRALIITVALLLFTVITSTLLLPIKCWLMAAAILGPYVILWWQKAQCYNSAPFVINILAFKGQPTLNFSKISVLSLLPQFLLFHWKVYFSGLPGEHNCMVDSLVLYNKSILAYPNLKLLTISWVFGL